MGQETNLIIEKMRRAFLLRKNFLGESRNSSLRLFNGFLEGDPNWVIDLFGETLVINNHDHSGEIDQTLIHAISVAYMQWLPWIQSVLLKRRYAKDLLDKRGKIIFGTNLCEEISEMGIHYAINLMINQDASFYMDTRFLRTWLRHNSVGKTILNTFAYTGSLGIAALMGGANLVMQNDLNRRFLDLARKSARRNQIPDEKMKFLVGDFYRAIGNLKKNRKLFDGVILDPPFFSSTNSGRVDLEHDYVRLINKVKPLISHLGFLVVVNNALYVSGSAFLETLEELCKDRYMSIEEIIPVPQEVIGYPKTIVTTPPVAPEPFNHSTKIVVLRVKRKDQKTATD